jgi:homocysteine S-methyltransferase
MSDRVRDLLQRRRFLSAAGTETYLVFQQGFALPEFCGFKVFEDAEAWQELERSYLHPILQTAADHGHGLLLDVLVWRAQPDYIVKLGYDADQLGEINAGAVSRTRECVERWRRRSGYDAARAPVLIAADIGPRGDGYKVGGAAVGVAAARDYHRLQLRAVAEAGVDLVCALTMTGLPESIGIVEAAVAEELPIIVSPTVETDGCLPDGSGLGDFVEAVDAATRSAPLFYMVNCAHPTHLLPTLEAARAEGAGWLERFKGFRANSSKKSHEELDESSELDRGDVRELAREVRAMRETYGLTLVGGCCGTDAEHLAAIAAG